MSKEIKRNDWSRFFKQFNQTHQHRSINISLEKNGKNSVIKNRPFIGLAMSKKGRVINGVELCTLSNNPEKLYEPSAVIKNPESIKLIKDDHGFDARLVIESKDGTTANLELNGECNRDAGIRQVAYLLFEQRGRTNGNDRQDWIEAEKRITAVEQEFTK